MSQQPYPPTLPSLGRGRAAPGTTAGVELCIRKSTKATPIALAVPHLSSPIMATVASQVEHSKGDSGQPGPGQQLYGFRKRRMAPRPWKASPRLSHTSLRPAMAPQWPARLRTAIIWFPKATPVFALEWPQWPASPRTAVIWLPKATDGTSALKGFAAPEPDQSFPPMATVASQAQDSNYMVSESDGWHLGQQRPRRAWAGPVFVQQWRHSGQPGPGQQLYMLSESDGWHLGLERPRRAWATPVFVQQWRQWPARPRTAVIIWLSFPPMATVASQAEDSS